MVKTSSIKQSKLFVLGIVANVNLEIKELHDDLEEEICVEQPKGFKVKGKQNIVCRLRRACTFETSSKTLVQEI